MGAWRSCLPIGGIELVNFGCSAWLNDGASDAVEACGAVAGALVEESAHGSGEKFFLGVFWKTLLEKLLFVGLNFVK